LEQLQRRFMDTGIAGCHDAAAVLGRFAVPGVTTPLAPVMIGTRERAARG